MANSGSRWMRLFRESFVPVIIVILGLFLMLLYVQFRAEYDADKVTVIEIQSVASSASDSESGNESSDTESIAFVGADPDQQRAHTLMTQKKWSEAERVYLGILARQHNSRALKDLGVLYMKKGDLPRSLDYFDKAIAADPSDSSALFNRALALSRCFPPP